MRIFFYNIWRFLIVVALIGSFVLIGIFLPITNAFIQLTRFGVEETARVLEYRHPKYLRRQVLYQSGFIRYRFVDREGIKRISEEDVTEPPKIFLEKELIMPRVEIGYESVSIIYSNVWPNLSRIATQVPKQSFMGVTITGLLTFFVFLGYSIVNWRRLLVFDEEELAAIAYEKRGNSNAAVRANLQSPP